MLLISQYFLEVHRLPFQAVDKRLFSLESILVLRQVSCNVVFGKKKKKMEAFLNIKRIEILPRSTKDNFSSLVFLKTMGKNEQRSKL